MHYEIRFLPRAVKDLESLPRHEVERILKRIETLRENLTGDVKKLTNYTPEYRLRVGNYRVLFEVAGSKIDVHRVLHRKDAY